MQFDDQFQKDHTFLVGSNLHFLPRNNVNHDHESIPLPHTVSALVEKQRLELEHFINLQNERLRIAMQEQRKQQISVLVKKYESKTQFLLKQKEEEMAKASNRTMELQNFLKRLESESQTWQRIAKENEAMVASLNSRIGRLRESAGNAAEDAESCCENGQDMEENATEKRRRKMVCKCCNSRQSCVVMLPCRHLCSCKDCEVFLDSCPVCRTVKKATVEALI
ncbi:UNVERIFIED_CONTAM: putative BOI-related E3 ubiquitin-protein ligase 3 [Sesamum radiatum]|uniref:BOI-related E3 ubiquitin-protein ligase 3 n=1 Tax=Sesamum radiatum TaxID=300843 RepID=A0AAW2U648_SESRA